MQLPVIVQDVAEGMEHVDANGAGRGRAESGSLARDATLQSGEVANYAEMMPAPCGDAKARQRLGGWRGRRRGARLQLEV